MLEINTKAPDFTLQDSNGKEVSLHDFKGKKVVIYFYPKDNTPGCTKQACAFKDSYPTFKEANIEVIGISKDSVRSHVRFMEKYGLPFTLLSDPDQEVIKLYDVLKPKKLYGKEYLGVVRSSYVIDEEGMIIDAKEKVKPDTNANDILQFLSL